MNDTNRVLVCGGRDYKDRQRMFAYLDALHEREGITYIIHGDSRGADRMSGEWGKARHIPVKPYPANWTKYGPSAGPIRNRAMFVVSQPHLVVAFPGGSGTADMISVATQGNCRVLLVKP